jgi:hypothetical protein
MGKSVLNAVSTGTTHGVMTAYASNRSVARSRTVQEKKPARTPT